MLKNKKAIESYFLILIVVTLIITFLFFFILDGIYGKDDAKCQFIDFKVKNICKNSNVLNFKIKNTGNKFLQFSINGDISSKYQVLPAASNSISIQSKSDKIVILPFLKIKGKNSFCKGKLVQYDIKKITKRC